MNPNDLIIRNATIADSESLKSLWEHTGLTRPWNDPQKDIERALSTWPQLFFIAEQHNKVIASAMAGYDGHRGAIYYFAVDPEYHNQKVGARLLSYIEKQFTNMGCPKINLCVRESNKDALNFYIKRGFLIEDSALLGKRLIEDEK